MHEESDVLLMLMMSPGKAFSFVPGDMTVVYDEDAKLMSAPRAGI